MKNTISWDITICGPLTVNGRFRESYHCHFQGRRISEAVANIQAYCKLLLFNREYGGEIFLRNVGWLLNDLIATDRWRLFFITSRNMKSPTVFEVIHLAGRISVYGLRFSRRWLWRMASSGMLRGVTLVRTHVSEELSASFISSPILVTLIKEALSSSETSVFNKSHAA
jgi:hypothetical protein